MKQRHSLVKLRAKFVIRIPNNIVEASRDQLGSLRDLKGDSRSFARILVGVGHVAEHSARAQPLGGRLEVVVGEAASDLQTRGLSDFLTRITVGSGDLDRNQLESRRWKVLGRKLASLGRRRDYPEKNEEKDQPTVHNQEL